MTKRLVELTPDILVRSQLLVDLCGYLQSLRYVVDSDQVLQFYYEVVPWWHILPCAPPGLGLPGLVGLLLHWGLFSVVASCTLTGWGRPGARGREGTTHVRFSLTSPSATMWATARRLISLKFFGRFLMSDSLKGPDTISFLNACTIMVSSLVFGFTSCAPKRLRNSFKGSPWYCLTSKRS